MCVKEFLGYNCGHCSIPYLRQCPLTESNKAFPPCKFAAERPIYTNENCHACARVLWNRKVLEEEGKHRQLHVDGLCACEVVFDSEERDRRARPRGNKGKGKMREIGQVGYTHGHDRGISFAGEGSSVGYQVPRPAMTQPENNYVGGETSRQLQDPSLLPFAYRYVGYFAEGGALAHVEKGYGFPEGGYLHGGQVWEGQLRIGQPGAGMRFYPEHVPTLPALPPIPALPSLPLAPLPFIDRSPRAWQRASSEPLDRINDYQASPPAEELVNSIEVPEISFTEEGTGPEASPAPVVVSSGMTKTASK